MSTELDAVDRLHPALRAIATTRTNFTPEAIPLLLSRMADVDVVFAGRRGDYERRGRRLTGDAHRRLVALLTGLPSDAGAFLAVTERGRTAMVDGAARGAPSVVVALGAARLRTASTHPDVEPGDGRSLESLAVVGRDG